MEPDAFLAQDKSSALFVHRVAKACSAQLVVKHDVWLAAMVHCQPSIDSLRTSFAAILLCIPGVM
jgi:hypothetical protein